MVIKAKKNNIPNLMNQAGPKKPKKTIKLILFFCLGFFIFFLVLFIMTMVFAVPLVKNLKITYNFSLQSYQAVKNQNLISAEENIIKTKESLVKAETAYQKLFWLKFIPFINNYYRDGQYVFQAAKGGIKAADTLVEALAPYADVLGFKGKGSFSGGTAEDRVAKIVATLSKVAPKIDEIEQDLEASQKSLALINPQRYPKKIKGIAIREKIIQLKELAEKGAQAVAEAAPAIKVLPEVLGYPEAKKYLLIMQNDGELRPTGGFMTAYAVIKIESGKITAEKSDDIYSLDKKIKTKVKAPEAIKKYLFNANLKSGIVPFWYLRDMNFSPDFKVSMSGFKKYYDKVPGEPEASGIIAIDTKVLKDLLTILGPIDVAGYGQFSMEKDPRCHGIPQIVCEIEHIVDTPIPGIKKGRKDILGPMMKTLLAKIFASPSSLWPRIFKLSLQEIREKHILFYFSQDKYQQAAEALNAAGRIKDFSGDYLHVNDSNFGGAKSDLFVERQVEQEVIIKDDGTVEKTLTLTYVNPEKMDNCNLERKTGLCLNGILRNFFRIYVPKGSKLIEGIGSETDIKTYESLNKTVFEGFFTLRGDGGKAKVIITYSLPKNYQPKNYQLLIQKQPGTAANHYKIDFKGEIKEFNLAADKEIALN